jgi:hypothetical protein
MVKPVARFAGLLAALALLALSAGCGGSGKRLSLPIGGYGSLRLAAESISRGCAKSAGLGLPGLASGGPWGFTLWLSGSARPVVYAATPYQTLHGDKVDPAAGLFSSLGWRTSLPKDATPVALWPCKVPVAFYLVNFHLWMQAFGPSKPAPLGRVSLSATFDSFGRWVTTSGTTIHYLYAPTVHLRGLPGKPWQTDWLAPSPSQAGSFLVEMDNNGCAAGTAIGRLYLLTPSGSHSLTSYDACIASPVAAWSDDGSKVMWTGGGDRNVNISDSSGQSRSLTTAPGPLAYALWSPNGKLIAYTYQRHGTAQVAVVSVATGRVRYLTDLRSAGDERTGQPTEAAAVGWSSRDVLIYHQTVNAGRTTIEAVPAAGGPARVVIQLYP